MSNPCPNPLRLSHYYAGVGPVPPGTVGYPYGVYTPVPTSGRIAFSNFHGATLCVTPTTSTTTQAGTTTSTTTQATGFFYTKSTFTATANQNQFNVPRAAGYILGQCLVFQNGILLDTTEYTDSAGTVTLTRGATSDDIISIMSFRSTSYGSTTISFNRVSDNLTNATTHTVTTGLTLESGRELLFINGTVISDQAYKITNQVISDFPNPLTGKLTIIHWVSDKPVNTTASTLVGTSQYQINFGDVNKFNLYNNGALLMAVNDYTTTGGTSYTLTSSPNTTTNHLLQQIFTTRTGAA